MFKPSNLLNASMKLENKHTNWLIVGCSHPVVMAFTDAIASRPPAAPRQCPIMDW